MSLVDNTESSDLRIYRPTYIAGVPQTEELSKSTAHVLHKIHSYYREARNLLQINAGDTPACSSLCAGLLDPVSNLVINSLICYRRKRKRDRNEPSRVSCEVGEEEDDDLLERRSLDGMVAFLTRLFPDLAETQAVRYLFLADTDAVVAADIIVSHVSMNRFFTSGAAIMEMALLKCAALAAGHLDPGRLVSAWRNISGRMDDALPLLNRLSRNPPSRDVPTITSKLRRMLEKERPTFDGEEDMSWVWQLAAARRPRPCIVPYRHTRLLTRTLHDTVHAFYLQAIARLPASELRSRFHRSLLRAGYCYGPLDPVSNIIINTIWYDAVFPPTKTLELNIIGTGSLQRMENRSVYGLASFICTRYYRLSFQQAVRCLLQADANLVLADHSVDPAQGPPDTGVEDAFFAAAKAACHPKPNDQVKFLTSCEAMLGSALSLLRGSNKLSSQDVQWLAKLLCPESSSSEKTGALLPLPLNGDHHVHTRISQKVNTLLNAYEHMPNGDPKFELHKICGVNDQVSRGHRRSPGYYYHHSHVNFMATPKVPGRDGVPTLLFAEISNGFDDTSFCRPLPLPLPCAAQIRCLHCEFTGTRIVHPVGIDFHGGESEFEKMTCKQKPYDDDFGSMDIINNRFSLAESIFGRVKEDSLYDDLDGHKIQERDLSSMSIDARILLLAKECASVVPM